MGLCEITVVRIQSLDEEQVTPLVFKGKKEEKCHVVWSRSLEKHVISKHFILVMNIKINHGFNSNYNY